MEIFESDSTESTERFGARLGAALRQGDCLALVGELGAGKTALVRGIAAGMGLDDTRIVTSPTYVLVQEYPTPVPLYHLDLYRMVQPGAELADLGLDEMLSDGAVVIEWAERASDALPPGTRTVRIAITGPVSREISVSA